ncbi:MAG: hypothetical protein ACREPL_08005 [Rhodanobacteraceae bacterium]
MGVDLQRVAVSRTLEKLVIPGPSPAASAMAPESSVPAQWRKSWIPGSVRDGAGSPGMTIGIVELQRESGNGKQYAEPELQAKADAMRVDFLGH